MRIQKWDNRHLKIKMKQNKRETKMITDAKQVIRE